MSLEVLTAWRSSLATLGELGGTLCGAIERDDLVAAIATMYDLRRVRSELARIERVGSLRGDRAEVDVLGDVASLVVGARAAEAAMQRWLERPLPADRVLLGSPLGAATLGDAMLPAVWDCETDLVVLVGDGFETVAQILGDLGQRRIVVLGRGGPGAVSVESVQELSSAIRTFVPNPPAQLAVRAAAGSGDELVRSAIETAREALSDLRIHSNTVRAFSRTWIEQGMANLPAIARWPSVAAAGDAFAGMPMVIVAPGPSLANNSHRLRALKGRAVIAAFSHSLKPVLAAGVKPDLVITVDPQDVRYHFAGCDLGETCVVNAATVHPSLFELPARRFMSLSANCAIDDWIFGALDEDALVPGGGSVATSAFSLALRLGCDPIVFVGLDLSFAGGAYYVHTCSDGAARAEVDGDRMRVAGWSRDFQRMKQGGGPAAATERVVELPGWSGGTVPSSFMFALFHRWFVERMRHVGGTTVYNCTEGGAYIEGMQHVPLAEVAFERTVDVAGAFARIDDRVDREVRTRRLRDHLATYLSGLRRCRSLVGRARSLAAAGDTAKLARVERVLVRALAPLGFVSLLAQREVDRAYDAATRDATADDYLAASRALFATLDSVIDQLEPALARAAAGFGV